MKWSCSLRTLYRGIKLVSRVARAKLGGLTVGRAAERRRLVAFDDFGDNPGRLRMLAHLPGLVAGRP
ncbi:MAG: hypothetical protein QOG73_120, partial [Acetobacteraceae bacterium]|nr:hypothetical protein [Acetobacteraceae bacterium]